MEKYFTFLFSDIEGSTRLWEQMPQVMSVLLTAHNQIMENAAASHGGKVFKTVGDGFYIVFHSAADALSAALDAQRKLLILNRSDQPVKVKVRMGLHTGTAEERNNDYFGPTLNRVARLMATASGGQTLISSATKDHLGDMLHPGIELKDLGFHRLRDIKDQEHIFQLVAPGLVNNFPPIKSLAPRITNLPAQLTSFLGREQDVNEVCRLFSLSHIRLITLLGPGGMGKSRLSLQVGTQLLNDFDDGVFFVALAPITSPKAVIEAISEALRLEDYGEVALIDAVKGFLKDRHVLLILDNFEQVVDAAPLLNELLTAAPHLKVLTTSREELLIYGEHVYRLSPLSLPDPAQVIDHKRLVEYAAIALFVDRVRSVYPDFAVDQSNAPSIFQICHRLDGLPLAIELAAVRCRDLSVQAIAEQLTNRLQVLNVGPRDFPSRQRTMRGAIEWSYDMLPAGEQRAFTQLGIFVGPFTAEAADAVTGAETLNRLLEKSLIRQVQENKDILTFVMLETLREFALERLTQSKDLPDLHRRHANYYRQLTETAEPNLTGERQVEWFNRLENEKYNIQTALEWLLKQTEIQDAGRMVAILWRFWSAHSQLSVGTQWMDHVLKHSDTLPNSIHAKLRYGYGRLLFLQYPYTRSTMHLKKSLSLYEQENDQHGQAAVYMTLGEIELRQANILAAENHFQSSLALYTALDDHAGLARCLGQLGRLAVREANLVGAESLFRQSLELTRQYGSTESIAMIINDLAEVLRAQKQYDESSALYRESLDLYRELDFDIGQAVILHNLGQVGLQTNHCAEALSFFQQALGLLNGFDEKQIIVECLAGIGEALVCKGDYERAVRFLSATNALMISIPVEFFPADQAEYERNLQSAQQQLTGERWSALWASAQTLTLNAIFAEALELEQIS